MKRETPSVVGAAESGRKPQRSRPKPNSSRRDGPIIVGVGASAGGLEAIQSLLDHLDRLKQSSDSGGEVPLSLAVAFHLDPQAKSLLPSVLSKHTSYAVSEIVDGAAIKPKQVYLSPPGAIAEICSGKFQLSDASQSDQRRTPIDYFLTSLARERKLHSIGVLLSGSGSDGAIGLKAVGDSGGMTMVQDPASAKFPSMPQAAIDSLVIDHIGTPEQLAHELWSYAEHVNQLYSKGEEAWLEAVADILPHVCEILREAKGHDFKHYKTSTLLRRTLRRLQILKVEVAHQYLDHLKSSSAEIECLFNDLLINVTAFFRDADAFEALQGEVLTKLLHDRHENDTLRIWVPGCASGEEAYTIAMLVRENLNPSEPNCDVQIFATDIDEDALAVARAGKYPIGIADHISPERLERFFIKKGQHYHVAKEIRELCLFSIHNLINDPPFSKLDLISCRNLLIYFGSHLQKKLIPLFHYALKESGFLFLGPSETLGTHRELFKPVSAKHRISQRLPTAIQVATAFDRAGTVAIPKPPNAPTTDDTDLYLYMQRIVLDEFAPKSAVVDEEGQIRCASGNLEKYLTVSAGLFQNNIVHLTRSELRVGLRAALKEATTHKRKVIHDALSLRSESGNQRVSVAIQPMPQVGEEAGLFLVLFQDLGDELSTDSLSDGSSEQVTSNLVEQLEREVTAIREDLEKTVQELETANEELKSSNEELLSMNEELQSANEELETSKEETQAVNSSLESVNSDLENLLISTQIATIFLDPAGNIRRVTPAATSIYNFLPTDIGRPLTSFTHRAVQMPPVPKYEQVLKSIHPCEDEVELTDGRWFLRRVLPYVQEQGSLDGLVVTFTEISVRKKFEAELKESNDRFRYAVAASRLGVWSWDAASDIVTFDERAAEIFGVTVEPAMTWTQLRELLHQDDRDRAKLAVEASLADRVDYLTEYRVLRPSGSEVWVKASGGGAFNADGTVNGMFGIVEDVTSRRVSEEQIRSSERLYRAIGESINYGVWVCDSSGRNLYASPSFLDLVGITQEQCASFGWGDVLHPDDAVGTIEAWQNCVRSEGVWDREHRFKGVDGKWHHILARGVPVRDDRGEIICWAGINLDVERQKLTESALRESEARLIENDRRKDEFLAMLAHELRNPLAAISNALEVRQRQDKKDEALQAWTERLLVRQSRHLARLVDDLLDLPRISGGKIQLRRERISLNDIIRGATNLAQPFLDEKNHRVMVQVPTEPIAVLGDATRLEQVVVNLLNNAAKYSDNGGTISVTLRAIHGMAKIDITDDGVGIEAELLERIFEPFAQVDSSLDRARGGLGLGLTLVRHLVELHNGTVSASSQGLGTGSTFSITLPILAATHLPEDKVKPAAEIEDLRQLRVLVVDDNEDSARSTAMLLQFKGCKTELAFDGTNAITAAESFRPEAILLDIGLPGMNGFQVAEQLRGRAEFKDTLLIALSGYGQLEDRRRSKDVGMNHHLLKPLDLSELLSILDTAKRFPL